MGATPLYHLSCRDKHEEIISCLNFLGPPCSLILVSGGLGPTKDDCTRQSLSQWLDRPLEHHANQWEQVQKKLSSRQVTLREGHKNQALIPKGATLLENPQGVAPGFVAKTLKRLSWLPSQAPLRNSKASSKASLSPLSKKIYHSKDKRFWKNTFASGS